jgi:hypothetical protein
MNSHSDRRVDVVPNSRESAVATLNLVQATELAAIIELEALWDDMRQRTAVTDVPVGLLRKKQIAYEAYRSRLVAFNKRHNTAYDLERSVSTPVRMERWFTELQILYQKLEYNATGFCPVKLIEKAYRLADRLAVRLNTDSFNRTLPGGLRAAIEELGQLAQWCQHVGAVASSV